MKKTTMTILPLRFHFNKPLFIGIFTSVLLHMTVLYTYVSWEGHDEKKSVKQESFAIPLSVFVQKRDALSKQAISGNSPIEQKKETFVPKKLPAMNKIEQKPQDKAPKKNNARPLTQDVTVEKNIEVQTPHTDSRSEVNTQNSTTLDSQRQSDPVVLNAQNTDQIELFTQIQKEITKKIVYPDTARKMKYEGITRFKFELLQDGSINHVNVTKSSHYASLDDAVLLAVKKASKHFPEVTKNYTIVMEIDFKISQ